VLIWVTRRVRGEGLTIACVGPSYSGKTHFYVLLGYHLIKKLGQGVIKYLHATGYTRDPSGRMLSFHDLLEMLSRGQKLPATRPSEKGAYKFLIRVKFPGLLWSKEVRMPLLDLSGETIIEMMNVVTDIRSGLIQPEDFPKRMQEKAYLLIQ